jgi:hypothetical protein
MSPFSPIYSTLVGHAFAADCCACKRGKRDKTGKRDNGPVARLRKRGMLLPACMVDGGTNKEKIDLISI